MQIKLAVKDNSGQLLPAGNSFLFLAIFSLVVFSNRKDKVLLWFFKYYTMITINHLLGHFGLYLYFQGT